MIDQDKIDVAKRLMKDGATPAEAINRALDMFAALAEPPAAQETRHYVKGAEISVMRAMVAEHTTLEDIVAATGLSADKVVATLRRIARQGWVTGPKPNGSYQLVDHARAAFACVHPHYRQWTGFADWAARRSNVLVNR